MPSFETNHTGVFNGATIAYRCLAAPATVPMKVGDAEHEAEIFSFSYLAETPGDSGDPASRPVLFCFNGGPGSASLWLHMGVMGPRRVLLPDAELAGAGPHPVIDNDRCPLDLADLVFIDPPGTGWSKVLGEAKPADAWGIDADARIIGEFIKSWLTRHKRWGSPRFMLGESYGTTRAVAVAHTLMGRLSGVAFNGIALVSAILDFHTARFEPGNVLPDVCWLPTYALTALHHGRVQPKPESREQFLDEIRRFAILEYLPALAAGSRLAEDTQRRVLRQLSRFTGLSQAWLLRARLRIEPGRFRKELLRERGQVVGRFDGRYLGTDHDAAGELPDADPSSYAIESGFVAAVNDVLGRELKCDDQPPYTAFNRDALTKWDWHGPKKDDQPRWPGYPNVAPRLGELLRQNPGLRVWIANGYYDMATPFYAVETTVAGNGVDTARVRMTYYDAGHMMYLHPPSFGRLMDDLREMIRPAG